MFHFGTMQQVHLRCSLNEIFVISRLFHLFPLVEVPVVRFGIPGLGSEFDDVWVWHLAGLEGLSEMDVHFPVSAVVSSVVELELEGASVPDVVVTLGDGEGVLGPSLDDPVALLFVAVPQHQAARLETVTDEDDLFVEAGAVELDIVGGSPVSSILSPPLSLDGESLGQREVEWVDNSLGETSEEVHACMTLPGKSPVEIGQAVFSPALSTFAPMVLAVTSAITVTVGIDAFVADGSEQMPGKGHLLSSGCTPVPVGVADGLLLVVPVGGIVLSLKVVDVPPPSTFKVTMPWTSTSLSLLLVATQWEGHCPRMYPPRMGPPGTKCSATQAMSPAQAPSAPVTVWEDQMCDPSSPYQCLVIWKGYFSVGFSL